MMNKYVAMSLVAIAVITAQVTVAADSPEMTKAKAEIDTLISNKDKAGLRALVAWIYFESKSIAFRVAVYGAPYNVGWAADENAFDASYDARDSAHDAFVAVLAAQNTTDTAYKQLLQYILKGVVNAGITLNPIDGLSPQCIVKALEKNLSLYPKVDCSKLKQKKHIHQKK